MNESLFQLYLTMLFVFVLDLGLVGVWLAIACDEWIRAILVIFRCVVENGSVMLLLVRIKNNFKQLTLLFIHLH